MKVIIEIEQGDFTVDILTRKTHYQASGTIVLKEDSDDLRDELENMAKRILNRSDNYTSSRASIGK